MNLLALQRFGLKFLWLISLPGLLLIFPQALYVKRTTLRLPEASGERSGTFAQPLHTTQPSQPDKSKQDISTHATEQRQSSSLSTSPSHSGLQMLHVGESTVAGVGVTEIQAGLTVNIARQLNSIKKQPIHWHIHGINGIRLNELLHDMPVPTQSFDLAVVTMGVNDTTKLTSINAWRHDLQHLIHKLKQHTVGPIFFTQVPPMMQFPALPYPLRFWLGLRSKMLDLEIQEICQHHQGVVHLGAKLKVERKMMAEDGYHPSALGYENWAIEILPKLEHHLT